MKKEEERRKKKLAWLLLPFAFPSGAPSTSLTTSHYFLLPLACHNSKKLKVKEENTENLGILIFDAHTPLSYFTFHLHL